MYNISKICLGTWSIAGAFNHHGKVMGRGDVNKDVSYRTLQKAIEGGITKFDTAASYGNGYAEKLMGEVVAKDRKRYEITTKVGFIFEDDGNIKQDFSVDGIKRALENSLSRMQTEYVDSLLLHNPPRDFEVTAEISNLMNDLLSQNVIKSYGISCRTVGQAEKLVDLGCVKEVQLYFNAFDRRASELLSKNSDVAINVRAPLAGGFLSSLDYAKNGFGDNDERGVRISDGEKKWMHDHAKKIFEAWQTKNPAVDAIRFCLYFGFDKIIVGCRDPKQVEDCLEAARQGAMTKEMIIKTFEACPEIYEGWR